MSEIRDRSSRVLYSFLMKTLKHTLYYTHALFFKRVNVIFTLHTARVGKVWKPYIYNNILCYTSCVPYALTTVCIIFNSIRTSCRLLYTAMWRDRRRRGDIFNFENQCPINVRLVRATRRRWKRLLLVQRFPKRVPRDVWKYEDSYCMLFHLK